MIQFDDSDKRVAIIKDEVVVCQVKTDLVGSSYYAPLDSESSHYRYSIIYQALQFLSAENSRLQRSVGGVDHSPDSLRRAIPRAWKTIPMAEDLHEAQALADRGKHDPDVPDEILAIPDEPESDEPAQEAGGTNVYRISVEHLMKLLDHRARGVKIEHLIVELGIERPPMKLWSTCGKWIATMREGYECAVGSAYRNATNKVRDWIEARAVGGYIVFTVGDASE